MLKVFIDKPNWLSSLILTKGGPGAGKTTYLKDNILKALKAGLYPDDIAFVSLTRKALTEIRSKIPFSNDFPYFKTIHSLCFHYLNKPKVITNKDLKEFSIASGFPVGTIKEKTSEDEEDLEKIELEPFTPSSDNKDDPSLLLRAYLSQTKRLFTNDEIMRDLPRNLSFSYPLFKKEFEDFVKTKKVHTFDSLIVKCIQERLYPKVSFVCIDEAQDLSPLQWLYVNNWLSETKHLLKRVRIAGDPDQAIFTFAGANVEEFWRLFEWEGVQRDDLTLSYRLSPNHLNLYQRVHSNVSFRIESLFSSSKANNNLQNISSGETISLLEASLNTNQSTVILFRENWVLREYIKNYIRPFAIPTQEKFFSSKIAQLFYSIKTGIPLSVSALLEIPQKKFFHWGVKSKLQKLLEQKKKEFDAEDYFLSIEELSKIGITDYLMNFLKRKEPSFLTIEPTKFTFLNKVYDKWGPKVFENPPKIKLSNIHRFKGGEADNVFLFTDIGNPGYNSFKNKDTKDEAYRTIGVGVSRAKENLYIIPKTTFSNNTLSDFCPELYI